MPSYSGGQDIANALGEGLSKIIPPSEREIVNLVRGLGLDSALLKAFLVHPKNYPYGRKLIYQSSCYEVLLMNWKSFMACAPHDHGQSMGWVFVLEGLAENTSYVSGENGSVVESDKMTVSAGDNFFAAKGVIHKMEAQSDSLLTLHIYTPPITGMKVFDINKCVGCIVSDDCGAWWPEEQRQLLKTFRIGT